MVYRSLLSVLTATLLQSASTALAQEVTLSAGVLTGGSCAPSAGAVYYKSIPYAKPPVGDLRLEPPQALDTTYANGSRNATTPAPACIQFGGGPIAEAKPWSEDCLYLDVWAPSNATNSSSLPVRVWLYGGADEYGGISDPTYDGCNVPATGAIMVALNYRVGPLGFTTVEDANIKGNQGIQDILMGLQWVKDNIAAFGGNPNQVMLHGQSAGATNAFTISSLPQVQKLIKAVVLQSGGGRDIPLGKTANYQGVTFAQALGCSSNDTVCLKSAPVSQYMNVFQTLPLLNDNALPQLSLSSINSYSYGPYVDGKVIPQQPSEVGAQVPAIFGANAMEGSLFALTQFSNGTAINVNASDYDLFLLANFGEIFVSEIKKYYPLSAFSASPYPAFSAISYVTAQASYVCSAERAVRTSANNSIPAWLYYFDHSPSCPWYAVIPQAALQLLGAAHTAEIPFVFGETSDLPKPVGTCNMSADDVGISLFMNNAWTSMAANAVPGDNTTWPQYMAAQPLTLTINNTIGVERVDTTNCELWDRINAFQAQLAQNGTLGGQNATSVVNATSANGNGEVGSGNGSGSASGSAASPTASNSGSWRASSGPILMTVPVIGMLVTLS